MGNVCLREGHWSSCTLTTRRQGMSAQVHTAVRRGGRGVHFIKAVNFTEGCPSSAYRNF